MSTLDQREREAMDHLLAFMQIIESEWHQLHNQTECSIHVHGLQGFVVQHMLQREGEGDWSHWFAEIP